MSLQEAASSGSFNPHVAKPSDTQRTDTPYDPPIADGDVDRVSTEPTSPFANPYDYAVSDDDVMGETGDPDMRASRRRAWTIVGLAIIIPAAVAAVIAWQLFGSNDAPRADRHPRDHDSRRGGYARSAGRGCRTGQIGSPLPAPSRRPRPLPSVRPRRPPRVQHLSPPRPMAPRLRPPPQPERPRLTRHRSPRLLGSPHGQRSKRSRSCPARRSG